MKKSVFSIIGALFLVSFMFVACEETEGVADPYTDWEARNQAYMDSIADVAMLLTAVDVLSSETRFTLAPS